jgi:spermidine/putrescine transport system substrate-binding protein
VPYAYGTTGLAYNSALVSQPISSWRDLLDPELAGKIALFNDPQESMTCLFLASGHAVNSVSHQALDDAEQIAVQLARNRVVLTDYVTIEQHLISGELAVGMAYSGDLLKATLEHPEIVYVIPREGSNRWVDSYAISRYSRRIREAHLFLDFVMQPAIAARISESQFYPTPNREAVALTAPEILSNPLVYPPPELLERCHYLRDVGELHSEYLRIYSVLAGAPVH